MDYSLWFHRRVPHLFIPLGVLYLMEHEEEYVFTLPCAYARSILTIPWVELGGKVNIHCVKTGYSATVTFHTKPFYGGKVHRYWNGSSCVSINKLILKTSSTAFQNAYHFSVLLLATLHATLHFMNILWTTKCALQNSVLFIIPLWDAAPTLYCPQMENSGGGTELWPHSVRETGQEFEPGSMSSAVLRTRPF